MNPFDAINSLVDISDDPIVSLMTEKSATELAKDHGKNDEIVPLVEQLQFIYDTGMLDEIGEELGKELMALNARNKESTLAKVLVKIFALTKEIPA